MAAADGSAGQTVTELKARFSPPDICAHVTRAVSEASLHVNPGAHLRVEQLFPPDFYELLLANLPATEFFPSDDFLEMNLRPGQCGVVPRLTGLLWEFIDNDVAHAITGAALQGLRPFIQGRYDRLFGTEWAETVFGLPHERGGSRLIVRRPGYREKPHCDPKEASATVLIHLTHPGDPEIAGTALYSIDGDFAPVRTGTSYPEAHGLTCTLVSRVPFRPNSALILVNADVAHCAEIPDDTGSSDRRQYAFQFHIGPNVPHLLDFVSTLPAADQQQWLGLARRRDP